MNLMQILTSENIVLIRIITIIFSFIQGLLFYKISTTILKIPPDANKKKIFIAIMSVFAILYAFIPNSIVRDAICIGTYIITLKCVLKQNLKNTFIAIVVSFLYTFLAESISNSLFVYIFKLKLEDFLYKPLYYFLSTATTFTLIYLMILLTIFIRTHYKKFIRKYKVSFGLTLIVNLLLGIITLTLETYIFSVYINLIPFQLLLTIIVSSLVYFILTLYSLIRTNMLEKTEEDLENVKLYNKTLSIMHDNIRGFKHDFNNIVQAIGGYVSLNDMEGLKDYYKRLLEECKLNNNLDLLNPASINNPSIYSLLTNKYFLANEKGIHVRFSIFSDLSKINCNLYEISRILGILLDNAIEAAEETPEKIIEIEFTSTDKKQTIMIRNTCENTNLSTTQIFEKGFSTKNRNSGYGLWNVHKMLAKNTSLDLYTTIKGNIFSQQFDIYY